MSAFHSQGRGHLDGPVVVLGTGLLGASIGLGLRGRGVPVFLSDPSPTNQAVAVDIGAGRPLPVLYPRTRFTAKRRIAVHEQHVRPNSLCVAEAGG